MKTRIFAAALFLFVALAAVAVSLSPSKPDEAEAGAYLGFPTVRCAGSTATVSFGWQIQAGAVEQWLDISTQDNGFAPGTFIASGPMSPSQTTLTWQGITAGVPHFWRLNTLTANGWLPSMTGAFVPCGAPALRWGPINCEGFFSASVDFSWAPRADDHAQQYIDIGGDPSFATGSFVSAGPIWPAAASFHWGGLTPDATYFFRIRTTIEGATLTSGTGMFTPECRGNFNGEIYASGDRLVGPGIDAPVNVRDVWIDGKLGDPAGPWDVLRYNFDYFPAVSAYPGNGGTTLIAGHVDYHDCGGGVPCLSVFAPLRNAKVGDTYTYYRADGGAVTYQVDWAMDFPPDYDWNSLLVKGGDSILLLTCNGTFDRNLREYSNRRGVHMVRVN